MEHDDSIHARRRTRLHAVDGIVLRRMDLGETDRVLTVFTREGGKVRVVAKGSRRTTSKLAGHIEPFTATRLLLATGRNLDIVSQAQAIETFPQLRLSERAIATSGYIAKLVDDLLPDEEPQPDVYDLALATFQLLNDGADVRIATHVFEMGLLRRLGYRPELYACVVCKEEIQPQVMGFALDAGVVCERCLQLRPDALPLSINGMKLLRIVDRGEIQRLFTLNVPDAVWIEVGGLLAGYIDRITGRESAARRVVRQLDIET